MDQLVEVCRTGAGQVGADRIRRGVWNQNASPHRLREEHRINEILKRLSESDRAALASALAREFETGVFETLKALEANAIPPFEDGYEGSPYDDFIGRLGGWDWPES